MKKRISFLLVLVCTLALTACNNRSMNYIIENEPSITAIVKETNEASILVENETGEYWVSLDVENSDSMTHFSIGDEVVVYYDGNIAESYPMQINRVYAITLRTPADRAENNNVLKYLTDEYALEFRLYGPQGHDLYVFHIFPDYAERECNMMMPENTDDVAEYHKDLSWEVVDEKLIITGAWEETFTIDISAETATSTATGLVYQICEKDTPVE